MQPQLRLAELAFAWAWTGECAFTVGLGVVAFRDGGPAAVGIVALVRMVPSAVVSPFLCAVADRMRRERVLATVSAFRALSLGAAAVLLEAGAPNVGVYTLAVLATIASTVFRPAHSALLPSLCATTRELTSANVVRGILDSLGALLGPLLAGVVVALRGTTAVFGVAALLSLGAAVVLSRIRSQASPRTPPLRSPAVGRRHCRGRPRRCGTSGPRAPVRSGIRPDVGARCPQRVHRRRCAPATARRRLGCRRPVGRGRRGWLVGLTRRVAHGRQPPPRSLAGDCTGAVGRAHCLDRGSAERAGGIRVAGDRRAREHDHRCPVLHFAGPPRR